MKITNYVLIFSIILILIGVPIAQQVRTQARIVEIRSEYNNGLDTAIDYALESIVESADGAAVEINFDECVDNFFDSVYAAFGALNSETAQTRLKVCVPVLAIVDTNGLYVYHSNLQSNQIVSNWTERIPYVYSTPSYSIMFSLGNTVTFKIVGDSTVYTGDYRSLKELYPSVEEGDKYAAMHALYDSSCLNSSAEFESVKEQTITDTIVSNLNYYVQQHNEVGHAYGFEYTFSLPSNAASEIARAIGDISFISFFQGYPYGVGTADTYSKFTVSGARLEKNLKYYLKAIDGYMYYHTEDCIYGQNSEMQYDTKTECAQEGAYPCPYCMP